MPKHTRTVVVVEDDGGMRQATQRLLRGGGFRVAIFDSAEALHETGAAAGAACLILDVRLPEISGLELARKLAEAGAHAPFIFITAHDDARSRAEAERAGAAAYLPKPFPGRLLLEAVARSLEPAASGATRAEERTGRRATTRRIRFPVEKEGEIR